MGGPNCTSTQEGWKVYNDYKVTVNQALVVEQYPFPTPDEIFSTLAGGKLFSNWIFPRHISS